MGARVLVVEDDPEFRGLLENVLSRDHEVVAVGSGTDAMEKLSREHFDLAILDIVLPGLTGLEVANGLLETRLPHPRVIIASGLYTEVGHREELRRQTGASAVLQKPFTLAQLRATVTRVLREDPPRAADPDPGAPASSDAGDDEVTLDYPCAIAFEPVRRAVSEGGTMLLASDATGALPGATVHLRLEVACLGGRHVVHVAGRVWRRGDDGVQIRILFPDEAARRTLEAVGQAAAAEADRPLVVVELGVDGLHDVLDPRRSQLLHVSGAAGATRLGIFPDLVIGAGGHPGTIALLQAFAVGPSAPMLVVVGDPPQGLPDDVLCVPDCSALPDAIASLLDPRERRAAPRIRASGLARIEAGPVILEGEVRDLSISGMCVTCPARLLEGAGVTVEFEPGDGGPTVRARTTVAWLRSAPGHRFHIGFTFHTLAEGARERIGVLAEQTLARCVSGEETWPGGAA